MRLKGIVEAGLLVALGSAGLTAEARAADLGPLYDTPAPIYGAPQQQMEFGTGWYLRGDGAYAEEDKPTFNAALGSFDRKTSAATGYAVGLGVGFKLDSYFRFDVTGDYLDRFDYQGKASCGPNCDVVAKTSLWRWDSLVNGYVDLGSWYGITPYIGAGAGVAGTHQDTDDTVTTVGGLTKQTQPRHNEYQFAWAAMAGVSYAFAPHAMVDIGYRYLDLGRPTVPLSPIASTRRGITEQQARVGLRYVVD